MTQANRNTLTSDRLTTVLSYGALILLGYLVFLVVFPFILPLAWSGVLAIFFYPVYEFLRRRYSANWSAGICTLGVTGLLIVPVLLILLYATREAVEASATVREALASGKSVMPHDLAISVLNHLPVSWQQIDFSSYLRQGAEKTAAFMASKVGALLKNVFSFVVNLLILLFALFFVFRDGEKIVRALRHLIPFERQVQDDMLQESRGLIFASVALSLAIAAVQGTLGGIAMAITGLNAPVFLGLLIGFCSIIPVVGSALVWVPAALWLGFSGHWGKALIVAVICGGIAGLADNLLRPLLLRNRTRLNDLLIFISIVGGLDVFGLLGLILGPTIVAAALGVLRVHIEHQEELERLQHEHA
ncbi:MAG TPA: AI-2E family transporter [Bryobacteraceae bacterium]|nr:AI-2E family transporter [Bryobacteraceae bacterium]